MINSAHLQNLCSIQIIMINTTLPANIGSAARAMHTMGLSNLTVINPKLPVDDSSYSHSAGGSHILDNINIVNTLEDAIADNKLIFAASSRSRTMPRPLVNPAQAAKIMANFLQSQIPLFDNQIDKKPDSHISNQDAPASAQAHSPKKPMISILFGREDRGLTNEELAVADYHIQIDANPQYPVLNVASAVQVISSFIYSHFYHFFNNSNCNDTSNETTNHDSINSDTDNSLIQHIRQQWDASPITHQQNAQLNDRIVELMVSLELADTADLKLLPQRLSRLTSRIQLDEKEYQLIQAMIGKISKRLADN